MLSDKKLQKNKRVYPAPLLPQTSLRGKNFFLQKNYLGGTKNLRGKSGAGFTIIELVIAIFVLSIAVVGIFSAFSIMVILTSEASDRLTGAYLAQEGIEIIRNIRDNNWLAEDISWDRGLEDCKDSFCEVDYTTTGSSDHPALPSTDRKLKIDLDNLNNPFYNYDSGTDTKFKREINIVPIANDDEILKVSVEVIWDQKPTLVNPSGQPGRIIAEETLYNWY